MINEKGQTQGNELIMDWRATLGLTCWLVLVGIMFFLPEDSEYGNPVEQRQIIK